MIVQPLCGQFGVAEPLVEVPSTAVIVTVGALSLQLWTSSLPCELVELVAVELALPPINMSTFHEAVLPLTEL
jgi:hypothetical protein